MGFISCLDALDWVERLDFLIWLLGLVWDWIGSVIWLLGLNRFRDMIAWIGLTDWMDFLIWLLGFSWKIEWIPWFDRVDFLSNRLIDWSLDWTPYSWSYGSIFCSSVLIGVKSWNWRDVVLTVDFKAALLTFAYCGCFRITCFLIMKALT